MGDKENKGAVNVNEFIILMKEIGLIPEKQNNNHEDKMNQNLVKIDKKVN